MKININNYEAYFLDYIEGRLDPQSIAELEVFLSAHPELNKKLEYFDQITVANDPIVCPDKESLKKFQFDTTHIIDKNFNDFCIAWFERQLNPEKAKELFNYLNANPDLNKDFNCFEKVYLKPQAETLFHEKKLLYKKEIQKPLLYNNIIVHWLSIAAGITILIAVYLIFINKDNNHSNVQLTSGTIPSLLITPKQPDHLKSFNPKLSKENNGLSYNKLNSNNLITVNIIDTLSNHRLDSIHSFSRENIQIAFIKSRELTIIEINNEDDLQNNLNSYIILTDNQYKPPVTSPSPNAFERLTKIKMDKLKNKDGKLSIVKIVQIGLSGINRLTDSNMRLVEKTDTLGNVIALSFESEAFEYHRIKGNQLNVK